MFSRFRAQPIIASERPTLSARDRIVLVRRAKCGDARVTFGQMPAYHIGVKIVGNDASEILLYNPSMPANGRSRLMWYYSSRDIEKYPVLSHTCSRCASESRPGHPADVWRIRPPVAHVLAYAGPNGGRHAPEKTGELRAMRHRALTPLCSNRRLRKARDRGEACTLPLPGLFGKSENSAN